MVIFHSYVKLPEGNYLYIPIWVRYSHPPWCEKCLDFPVVPMDRQIWSGTLAVVSLSLSERLVAVSAPAEDSLIQSSVQNMNHGSTSPWWFVYGEPSDHKPMRFNEGQHGVYLASLIIEYRSVRWEMNTFPIELPSPGCISLFRHTPFVYAALLAQLS